MLLASISFHQLGYIVNQKHTHTSQQTLSEISFHAPGHKKVVFFLFFFIIHIKQELYVQLSISTGQSWLSSGKYLRFMGHDAVIVILPTNNSVNNEI